MIKTQNFIQSEQERKQTILNFEKNNPIKDFKPIVLFPLSEETFDAIIAIESELDKSTREELLANFPMMLAENYCSIKYNATENIILDACKSATLYLSDSSLADIGEYVHSMLTETR